MGTGEEEEPAIEREGGFEGIFAVGCFEIESFFFLRNEIESYASSRDDDPNNFTPLIVAKPACFKPNIEQAYYLGSGRT